MKIFNYKSILATVFLSLNTVYLFAKNQPPAPKGAGGFDEDWVVGGPIDDYLPLLFFVALAFGATMIARVSKMKSIKL